MIAPNARGMPARLYVAGGRVVSVVDPATLRVAGRAEPWTAVSGIVPSWDLRRLWAIDRAHGALVPVGPRSGRRGRPVPVTAPAGLYFTPDGQDALVLARRPSRIDVRDPRTMAPRAATPLPCDAGHADFTPDETSLVATCTAAGTLVRVDLAGPPRVRDAPAARRGPARRPPAVPRRQRLLRGRRARGRGVAGGRPAVRAAGVRADRAGRPRPGDQPGRGPAVRRGRRHPQRRRVPVAAGRVPLAAAGRRLPVPGGVSSDGTALWLADPAGLVYAVSTRTGRVVRKVRVAGRPSGLCVHPQPGRYSLGGTGLYR
ncbi:hypothetical protein [Actinomadura madurae]|uniref:hypothetical protein n=1 Tax=Actinomadura madurae TaxID=1993 RepID=UPI0020D257F1|nr:hypothetical protein [Actinomadura madurae]MCQ0016070.1 hypothetical protein [Actinomadura madurae]